MKSVYIDSKHPLIKKFRKLYKELFKYQSGATATNLTFLALSWLVFNACSSIHFAHKHLLRDLAGKGLNLYYYTLNESVIEGDDLMRTLVVLALLMIPANLANYPILFSFDDFF